MKPSARVTDKSDQKATRDRYLGLGIAIVLLGLLASLAWMGNQWAGLRLGGYARPGHSAEFSGTARLIMWWGRCVAGNIPLCLPIPPCRLRS